MQRQKQLWIKVKKWKKNGYLGKTLSLEAKALCAQEVSDFVLCSTCGCCCWGRRWSDFMASGRTLWRLSFMCWTSSLLQHIMPNQTNHKPAALLLFDKPPMEKGQMLGGGPHSEFLLELDAESSSRVYGGLWESKTITLVKLMPFGGEKNVACQRENKGNAEK